MTAIVLLIIWNYGSQTFAMVLSENRRNPTASYLMVGVSKIVTWLGIAGIIWWVIVNADLIADHIKTAIN